MFLELMGAEPDSLGQCLTGSPLSPVWKLGSVMDGKWGALKAHHG